MKYRGLLQIISYSEDKSLEFLRCLRYWDEEAIRTRVSLSFFKALTIRTNPFNSRNIWVHSENFRKHVSAQAENSSLFKLIELGISDVIEIIYVRLDFL